MAGYLVERQKTYWPPDRTRGVRLKVHRRQGDVLVAVCDSDLIGRELDSGTSTFTVTESFYGDETVNPERAKELLIEATIVNVLGEQAVRCAVEAGVVDEANVVTFGEVPHAQMVRILR